MQTVGTIIGVILGLLVLIILGTLLGAVTGWIVGLFFGAAILDVFREAGVSGISMWQLGATLGFVGGFFRSAQVSST